MRIAGTQGQTTQLVAVPCGRLFVPAAYYQASGAGSQTMDGAEDRITFSWVQECDMALTSLSIRVASVTTQGNINVSLYTDNNGVPGTQIADLGALDCGASPAWVRHTFAAQQLTRDVRYHLVFTGTAGKNYAIAYRRWNTVTGSLFPDGAISKTALNGAGSWIDLTQDDTVKPALFLVVLNSQAASHNPMLWYGQHNGGYVYLPGSGLVPIPSEGVSIDCSALTADTLYNIYVYLDGSALALEASTTDPAWSNGILVKSGAVSRRHLGIICPKTLLNSLQGPVDVGDQRLVINRFNQKQKFLGKLNPFAAQSSVSGINGTWAPLDNGWKVEALADGVSNIYLSSCALAQDLAGFSFGLDSTSTPSPYSSSQYVQSTGGYVSLTAMIACQPTRGLHYFIPLQEAVSAGSPTIYSYYPTFNRALVTGEICC
jgi:hypothetical protein